MVLSPLNSESAFTLRTGYHPLLLDNEQQLWLVLSGEISVCLVEIEDKQPRGRRSHLLTVRAGEVLFGVQAQASNSLIAIAVTEATLKPISLENMATKIVENDQEAISLLNCWFAHLGETVSSMNISSIDVKRTIFSDFSYGSWVKVLQKNVYWLGSQNFRLDCDLLAFPLIPDSWLDIENLEQIQILSIADLRNAENIKTGLVCLHKYFLSLSINQKLDISKTELKRLQNREKIDYKIVNSAVLELNYPLESEVPYLHSADIVPSFEPLVAALGAIAKKNKIALKLPSRQDYKNQDVLLEQITRVSNCRIRKIALTEKWWTKDYGALLIYMPNSHPAALLPVKNKKNKYVLFYSNEIGEAVRIPVTDEVALPIELEAHAISRSLPSFINNNLTLLKFGTLGYKRDIVIIVLLGIAAAILAMIPSYVIGLLIDTAIPDGDYLLLWQIALSLIFAAFGQAIFRLSQDIAALRIEGATDSSLQLAVWDKLLKISPSFFRQYSSGELADRLFSIDKIRNRLSGATQRTLLSGLFSLSNLGLMLMYHFRLTLIGIILAFTTAAITFTLGLSIVRNEQKKAQLNGEIYGFTIQLINSISKLRGTVSERRAFAVWARKYARRIRLQDSIKRTSDGLVVFNEILPLISSVLLFWFATRFMGIGQILENPSSLTTGGFLAFNAAFAIFINSIIDLSNSLTDITSIVILWQRAKTIFQAKVESDNTQREEVADLRGGLLLENLSFQYQTSSSLVLNRINIHAAQGEFIAIVGPSGAGKSTIMRLLLGFENPTNGSVSYDGKSLNKLELTSLRKQLGVVLQDGIVQQSSIFENISGGALITIEEAWQAARLADLADDIERMPMKMHTEVNERGSTLSGGQRQRLLIARALVNQPKILLLDEATSSLDNRTQELITKNLESLSITRVVIAHRFSTVRNADRIYVMDSGQIVQTGSFEELVNQEGLFSRLILRQL